VHRPVLGKRRSVTRLRSADLEAGERYVLTTQDHDSHGELQTKLYKGDVLPTVGGGSQVVLRDVEILQQRDPLSVRGSVKRPSQAVEDAVRQEQWRALTGSPRGKRGRLV